MARAVLLRPLIPTKAGADLGLRFLIDAKKPVIDGVSGKDGSDTLEVATGDTITDGGRRSEFAHDRRPIVYKLFERAGALNIDLGGTVLKLANAKKVPKWRLDDSTPPVLEALIDDATTEDVDEGDSLIAYTDAHDEFNNVDRIQVMFANDGSKPKGGVVTSIQTLNLTEGSPVGHDTAGVGAIETGLKTVKVTATDFAGNVGPTAEYTDVYVDVDDLKFNGLFPREDDITTIEETSTADVRFSLSEHADSVLITYKYVSGRDRPGRKTRAPRGWRASRPGRAGHPSRGVHQLRQGRHGTG